MMKLFKIFCFVTCSLFMLNAHAEEQVFGDYTVNYVAVYSNFLQPEIAERYGIVRSPRNAFLNISVIKNDDGTGKPVAASVTGEKANLIGQSEAIEFIEVREGDAIYYLGQFEFSNAETLQFNLDIQPENSGPGYSLSWTTQLYIN